MVASVLFSQFARKKKIGLPKLIKFRGHIMPHMWLIEVVLRWISQREVRASIWWLGGGRQPILPDMARICVGKLRRKPSVGCLGQFNFLEMKIVQFYQVPQQKLTIYGKQQNIKMPLTSNARGFELYPSIINPSRSQSKFKMTKIIFFFQKL